VISRIDDGAARTTKHMNQNRSFVNSKDRLSFSEWNFRSSQGAWIPALAAAALAIEGQGQTFAGEAMRDKGPVKVEILRTNDGYQLYVDHKPFYIKGAGLGSGTQEKLVEHGGNSIRTWRTEGGRVPARQVLANARTNGLYVTMGLEIGCERHGFDYNDAAAVARQLGAVKAEVLKYKDDPTLIIWAIGNELNLDAKNPKVWDAVNDISKMIHQVDPNHLTTTPLAGFKREVVQQVKTRAPDLDLLSFQMYADIVNLPRYLREAGWNSPYMVTEWGATGHWEVAKTDWGAPIENDSTTKANLYRMRFEKVIQPDNKLCLGSYVFFWGQKQERTPTWYGMFLETNPDLGLAAESLGTVDTMAFEWSGATPSNRAPDVTALTLNGTQATDSVTLTGGQTIQAQVTATEPDGDKMSYVWELLQDPAQPDLKGGPEAREPRVGAPQKGTTPALTLTAPAQAGQYRLLVYVLDGKGHAGTANVPFRVN